MGGWVVGVETIVARQVIALQKDGRIFALGYVEVGTGHMQSLGEGLGAVGLRSTAVAMDRDKEIGVETVGHGSPFVQFHKAIVFSGKMDREFGNQGFEMFSNPLGHLQGDQLFEGALAPASAIMSPVAGIQNNPVQAIGFEAQGVYEEPPKDRYKGQKAKGFKEGHGWD